MNVPKFISAGLLSITATLLAAFFVAPAQAAPMVTYTWTTTSQGYGPHVSQPSSATFEVPLSDVLAGVIPQWDITDVQLSYPGLTFNSSTASSGGLDFAAYVDPATGAFIYHDAGQGLAVIAFAGTDINNATTFLSITLDMVGSGGVADQFNALDAGAPYAGYPTAGYWTASIPALDSVPEPSGMALTGLGLLALAAVRRKAEA